MQYLRRYPFFVTVILPIIASVIALLVSLLFPQLFAANPLLLFWIALFVSIWYGGLLAGLVCVVLSFLSTNYFFFTPQSVFLGVPADFVRLVSLLVFVALMDYAKRSQRQAREALERSRSQLDIILRDVADGITAQAPSGELIYANHEAARALGYISSEYLLKTPVTEIMKDFELFDEDGEPFPLNSLPGRQALLGMQYPKAIVRFRTKSTGEERWSSIKARPVLDASGNVQFAINLFQDITLSKRAEQAIFKQREQLRVTLVSIGDAVIATDTKSIITFFNPVAAQLTGWQEIQALGKPLDQVFRIISEDTRQPVKNPVERVLREGIIAGLANHTLLIDRNGNEIPINDSGAPIRDQAGELIGAVLVFRSIAEERKAARALEASEARYRVLVENATDIIYSLDLEGNLTSVNRAGEVLLGYSRDELIGKSAARIVAPEYLELMQEMLRRKVEGQEETIYEIEVIAKDGTRHRVEINSRFVKEDGIPTGTLGIARLITRRKNAE